MSLSKINGRCAGIARPDRGQELSMQLLQWKPSYLLGIPEVDLEHRQMIHVINDVYRQLEDKHDSQPVQAAQTAIRAGISAHFAREERVMREAAYPEYAAHKENHEKLLAQIRDIVETYANDPEAGRAMLQSSLSGWFDVHFATFDTRLHEAAPYVRPALEFDFHPGAS